jgi:thiol-disulfide isomerase/thioredoxin
MRKSLVLFIISIAFYAYGFAQGQYEVLKDNDGGKILKGIISRDILAGDTSFKWYKQNLKIYTGGKDAVTFGKHKDSLQLVIFMGTWCEDSQFLIPKLFPFFDAAGFSNDRITLIGVDRNKKSISHITDAFNVINVPTVIVMKEGKELGRVVEYGKYGAVEKELAEIADKDGIN